MGTIAEIARGERIGRARRVSIRAIARGDGPALADFYANLSRESLRRRFLGCRARFDPHLVGTFTGPDGDGLVGILDEPGPNDGAVVAHAYVQPDGHGGAEVAFAVADELQGQGIGRRLMERALDVARELGLRCVTATLLADNTPMRRLLCGAGCVILTDAIDAGSEEIGLRIGTATASCRLAPAGR